MASLNRTLILLCVLVSFVGVSYGDGVSCIVCNSHPEEDGEVCDDPINYDELEKTNLTQSGCNFCRKYVQDVDNNPRLIQRTCAEAKEEGQKGDDDCLFSTGVTGIQLQICTCKLPSDGKACNGGTEAKPVLAVLVSAVLLSIAAKLMH